MKFELKILTEDKSIKEICKLFWKIQGFEERYQFEKKVQDIAEEKQLTSSQISQIAKVNSELWVSCTTCNTPFLVKNRNGWIKLISKEFFFEADCKKCRQGKEEIEKGNAISKLSAQKYLELENAFKAKRWKLCDRESIEILIIIADGFNTKKINSELFRPMLASPDFNVIRWNRINKLEELGLIWVERENPFERKSKVKEFHILNRLREILHRKYKEEFKYGESILNANQIEIISDINNSKSGFIEGEFTLSKNVSIKSFKQYEIKMTLEKKKKQFKIQIKEK